MKFLGPFLVVGVVLLVYLGGRRVLRQYRARTPEPVTRPPAGDRGKDGDA